jgi:hypothetical protein
MSTLRGAVGVAAVLISAAATLEAAAIKVGSVTDARVQTGWTLDGADMASARAKLLSVKNFGPSGTVRRTVQISDTAASVGSLNAALLDQFEVFFIGWIANGSSGALDAEEMRALATWVYNGGSLIATCDDSGHDAVCASFGFPIAGWSAVPGVPAPRAGEHPLVAGAFGTAAQLYFSGNQGFFSNPVGGIPIFLDSSPDAEPVIIVRRWGAGRVIVVGDVDIIADTLSPGSTITTDNDRFLGNLFAFAARPYDLLIDAAAHTTGLGGTTWRSDIDLLNVGDSDTTVSIAQLKVSQSNLTPNTSPVSVPAGGTIRLFDVLAGLFTGSNAAFGLTFTGGQIHANSRFYNVGSAGGAVYGMYVPSTSDRETVWYGRPAVFHHLSYTPGSAAGTRVNIGGASRVPYNSTVIIRLYGDAGELLGTKTQVFASYEHRQITKIHESLGTPAVTHGYATVEVTTPGGAVDMYAMLIENQSGDPIFMPPTFSPGDSDDAVVALPGVGSRIAARAELTTPGLVAGASCTGPYQRIVAAAANTGGLTGTRWQSDVDLLNLGADAASIDVACLKANQANTNPLVVSVEVPAGQTVRLTNILDTLLPATNAGLGIRFCRGETFVNSRFYNTGSADGKVYGMYIPSMAPEQTVTPCRPAVFHHLSYSTDTSTGQRINIGATNATNVKTAWVIRLYGDSGELLGTLKATLQPYEHHQYTNIHKILATPAVTHGWATVEVTTPGAAIHPYAMRIENIGGDPIYMPAELENVATSPDLAAAFAGQWTGHWHNATFGTSGNATLTLTPDLPAQSVEAVIDLDGNVFGAGDPPPQTLIGAFTERGLIFKGTSPLLGTYAVSADGLCSVSGQLTDLPNPLIASVHFEGTATTTAIALTYTIDFTPAGGGGTATGTLTLSK